MAVLISDNYDSYSPGSIASLNGGSGWSGSYRAFDTAQISTAQSVSASNSVTMTSTQFFARPLSLSGFFTWSFSLYISSLTNSFSIGLDNSTLSPYEVAWFFTSSGARASWINGSALVNQSVSYNAWNKFDMEVNASTGQFRARINNAAWTSWTAGVPGGGSLSTSFNRILAQVNSATVYVDNTEFTDTALPIIPNELIQMIII